MSSFVHLGNVTTCDYNSMIAIAHFHNLKIIEILIPGDRCRTGCHDITLQNMQIVFDSVHSLSK